MRSSKTTNFFLGLLLAAAGLFASFAVVATAPAQTADSSSSSTTTTTTTTTASTTTPLDIANDVTVGGVPVGGMGVDIARVMIEAAFDKTLVLRIAGKRVALAPS